MTDTHIHEKPTLEERYTTAAQSSNLRVEAERFGDADVLIAAGWSQMRIGGALLRLHTEFDSSPRPRLATRDSFLLEKDRKDRDARTAAARKAHAFNLHEMGVHLQRMKSLPDVREQITLQVMKWGGGASDDPITRSDLAEQREHDAELLKACSDALDSAQDDEARAQAQATLNAVTVGVNQRRQAQLVEEHGRAQSRAVSVLQWWLAQACPECGGTKFQTAEGTGRHTAKLCGVCKGTGKKDIPQGQLGRKLANWMDRCVEIARANIGGHLGSPRGRVDHSDLIRGRCESILARNPNDDAARKVLSRLPALAKAK